MIYYMFYLSIYLLSASAGRLAFIDEPARGSRVQEVTVTQTARSAFVSPYLQPSTVFFLTLHQIDIR